MAGTLVDGLSFYGPFPTMYAAKQHADKDFSHPGAIIQIVHLIG